MFGGNVPQRRSHCARHVFGRAATVPAHREACACGSASGRALGAARAGGRCATGRTPRSRRHGRWWRSRAGGPAGRRPAPGHAARRSPRTTEAPSYTCTSVSPSCPTTNALPSTSTVGCDVVDNTIRLTTAPVGLRSTSSAPSCSTKDPFARPARTELGVRAAGAGPARRARQPPRTRCTAGSGRSRRRDLARPQRHDDADDDEDDGGHRGCDQPGPPRGGALGRAPPGRTAPAARW